MSKETDRIWILLVEEIQTQIAMISHWKVLVGVSDEVRERQLYGFECQLSALVVFGTKLFGYPYDDLKKFAERESNE